MNQPNIVHTDDSFYIVNKPAGLLTNNVEHNPTPNLCDWMIEFDPSIDSVERQGMVHRLDKDTTGLLVFARTQEAYEHLKNQFFEKTNYRSYLALLDGPVREDETIVENRIIRKDDRFYVSKDLEGKPAKSLFKVKKVFFDQLSYCEVQLATGRTHQIRVHAKHLGKPVVGDKKYHPHPPFFKKNYNSKEVTQALKKIDRQMLHAYELGITHPVTNKKVLFQQPLAADFSSVIDALMGSDPIV